MRRVLITGGNGFIGSHLGELLSKEGKTVSLLDLGFDWHTEGLNCRKVVCDVLNRRGLEVAAKDVDGIVHLAAVSRVEDGEKDPRRCKLVNVDGTRNVVNVAADHDIPLVLVSSREVYGNAIQLPVTEKSPKKPISVYAKSKLEAEREVINAGKSGLHYAILRLSNVYGSERDRRERVIPTFVRQATTGRDITIHGGTQSMDFTFVDDVVDVISKVVENIDKVSGEDYNVVTGHSISVSSLARLVKDYTHSSSRFAFQDEHGYFAHEFTADPSKITTLMKDNHDSAFRPVEEGLGIYVQRVAGSLTGLVKG